MDSEITIIGAGVVGLSIAKSCSKFSNKIFLVEKNNSFGLETSSRNSEVIHSGIYYPINSLKSNLCIAGRKKLYNYCDKNKIPYNKCGKLIIAQNQKEKGAQIITGIMYKACCTRRSTNFCSKFQ